MTDPLHLNLHTDGLAAVALAKSRDETRYYMNGVFVTPWAVDGESGVMMVATDSYILATYFDPDGEASRSAIIDGNFSSGLLKSGRSEKSPRRLISDGEIGRVQKTVSNPETAGLIMVREIDRTFPKWQKIIELPDRAGSPRFSWSHTVLDRICKIAHRLNGPAQREIDVFFPEKDSQALFTFGASCRLSVIAMPMRGGDAQRSYGWRAANGEQLE